VFIDRKVPRGNRGRFPIVTIGGEVAWLPGIARASIARITEATERILRVEAREIGV
jgi:tRNA(Ile) lysidine synthetase-like protein